MNCVAVNIIMFYVINVEVLLLSRRVEEERKRLQSEVGLLDGQLHEEQDANDDKSDRVTRLEKDLRNIRVQLEQKIELGKY